MMDKPRVLITGGSTRVMIDQVRCIGNIFKGRTAIHLADHFIREGCDVVVIGNPGMSDFSESARGKLRRLRVLPYKTYDQLYKTMEEVITNREFDVIIHSAAVSDYRVADVLNSDMKSVMAGKVSSDSDELYLKMVPTEKIVDKIRGWGHKGKLVKFKLQVDMPVSELIEVAKNSRKTSDADVIVANCLEWARDHAILINRDGEEVIAARNKLPHELYEMVMK
jgi:phosphopantothenate-cysteine ligase/phosphopantothenoylcysteine decarboxylase/phosphopantothenate--cysteine ligase